MAPRVYVRTGDINRLNDTWHVARALDFKLSVLKIAATTVTFAPCVTLGLPPPPIMLPYIREAGFEHAVRLRNFIFDGCLIFAFVKWWRPETYTFNLPWGEASITLKDVAYYTGLCTTGEPVGGCTRDFQRWHQHPIWEWIEDLLGAKLPPLHEGRKQVFAVRITWLRDRVAHIPDGTALETLRQCARCYLMMLIGGFLFTDKSATLVSLRWLPLLEDFNHVVGRASAAKQISHDGRILSLRRRIDALTFEQGEEAARGQQHRPADPVNVDEYLFKTTRGDDTWWPNEHLTGTTYSRAVTRHNTWLPSTVIRIFARHRSTSPSGSRPAEGDIFPVMTSWPILEEQPHRPIYSLHPLVTEMRYSYRRMPQIGGNRRGGDFAMMFEDQHGRHVVSTPVGTMGILIRTETSSCETSNLSTPDRRRLKALQAPSLPSLTSAV
ncbi:hypothetical protein Ahy_B03g068774 [Arachis hypogaea]|uniref:Aminotransferase-like plant mobile domain-containing protein n=1 Tax=Arachis hypogaea TaxID=3818 RepID=A0A445AAS6_ARAHY|nr:hypothetical protein Ahy_B03g068774 [Arachis hypogaea]